MSPPDTPGGRGGAGNKARLRATLPARPAIPGPLPGPPSPRRWLRGPALRGAAGRLRARGGTSPAAAALRWARGAVRAALPPGAPGPPAEKAEHARVGPRPGRKGRKETAGGPRGGRGRLRPPGQEGRSRARAAPPAPAPSPPYPCPRGGGGRAPGHTLLPLPSPPRRQQSGQGRAGPAPGAAQHTAGSAPIGARRPLSLRSAATGSRLRRRLTSPAGGSCRSPGRRRLPQRGCGPPRTSERPWWQPVSDAPPRHLPPALSRRRLSPPAARRPGAALPPPPPPHWPAPPRPAPPLTGAGAQHSHGPAPVPPPRWLPIVRPALRAPPLHNLANREAARGEPSPRLAVPARFPWL